MATKDRRHYLLCMSSKLFIVYRRAGGKLTVADIKNETLTIEEKTMVGGTGGVVPDAAASPQDDDDGAMSDEEKQAILEEENVTQVRRRHSQLPHFVSMRHCYICQKYVVAACLSGC